MKKERELFLRGEAAARIYGAITRVIDGKSVVIPALPEVELNDGEVPVPYSPKYEDFEKGEFKVYERFADEYRARKVEDASKSKKEFNRIASGIFGLLKLSGSATIDEFKAIALREYIRLNGRPRTADPELTNKREVNFYINPLLSALEYFGILRVDTSRKTVTLTEKGKISVLALSGKVSEIAEDTPEDNAEVTD